MASELQKATRNRNFAKKRIRGVIATLKQMAYSKDVSEIESLKILLALEKLESIEKNWEVTWEKIKKKRRFI